MNTKNNKKKVRDDILTWMQSEGISKTMDELVADLGDGAPAHRRHFESDIRMNTWILVDDGKLRVDDATMMFSLPEPALVESTRGSWCNLCHKTERWMHNPVPNEDGTHTHYPPEGWVNAGTTGECCSSLCHDLWETYKAEVEEFRRARLRELQEQRGQDG